MATRTLPPTSQQMQASGDNAPNCFCGIPANEKAVTKQGPNNGRIFYTCSRWRPDAQLHCNFFKWKDAGATAAATPSAAASPNNSRYSHSTPYRTGGGGGGQPGGVSPSGPSQYSTPYSQRYQSPAGNHASPYSPSALGSIAPSAAAPPPSSGSARQALNFNSPPFIGGTDRVIVTLELVDDTTFGAKFRYNETLKDYIKHFVPPAKSRWSPDKNMWTFDVAAYEHVLEALEDNVSPVPVIVNPIPAATLARATAAAQLIENNDTLRAQSRASHSEVESRLYNLGPQLVQKLFGFQRDAVRFALERHGRVLLGDDMGLGKTVQALCIAACYSEDWPLLIVCPSVMKLVWEEAIHTWLPPSLQPAAGDVVLLADSKSAITKIQALKSRSLGPKIVITSYDLVKRVLPLLRDQLHAGVVIADESHHLKNGSTQRTQAVAQLVTASRRAILISGTPALSRPFELFPQINMLRPGLLGSVDEFGMRYCAGKPAIDYRFASTPKGMDYRGASCLDELRSTLEREVMIRRTKADVLTELPEKLRKRVPVEISDAAQRKALQQVVDEMAAVEKAAHQGRLRADEADLARQRLVSELYRKTGKAKVKEVAAHCKELLEAGEKIVVFAHHKEVLDELQSELCGAAPLRNATTKTTSGRGKRLASSSSNDATSNGCVRIDGSTNDESRKRAVDTFQNDAGVRVALLSINAAGVGITLTAATCVVFAELAWTPGSLVQAEDRAHRMGLRTALDVHYITASASADDFIWNSIRSKLGIVSSALGSAPGEKRGTSSAGDVFADMQVRERYEHVGLALAQQEHQQLDDGDAGTQLTPTEEDDADADEDYEEEEEELQQLHKRQRQHRSQSQQRQQQQHRHQHQQQQQKKKSVTQGVERPQSALSDAETQENPYVATVVIDADGDDDVDSGVTEQKTQRRRRLGRGHGRG